MADYSSVVPSRVDNDSRRRQNDKKLVKTLIGLAKGLGYRVVAEGVENQEVLALLTQWGCSEAQGYLIGKPMSPKALEAWIGQTR